MNKMLEKVRKWTQATIKHKLELDQNILKSPFLTLLLPFGMILQNTISGFDGRTHRAETKL